MDNYVYQSHLLFLLKGDAKLTLSSGGDACCIRSGTRAFFLIKNGKLTSVDTTESSGSMFNILTTFSLNTKNKRQEHSHVVTRAESVLHLR